MKNNAATKEKTLSVLWLGCGDICIRSAANLPSNHIKLTAVSRSFKKLPNEHTHLSFDATDKTQLRRALTSTQAQLVVVSMTPGGRTEQHYRDSYLRCVEYLHAIISEGATHVGTVIFASSTSVYHQHKGEIVDENSSTEPEKATARILLDAEHALRSPIFARCCVRFSGLYGPGRFHLLKRVCQGDLGRQQFTNRIHVDDCAGLLNFLIEQVRTGHTLPEVLLASDDQPVTSSQLRTWLAQRLNQKIPPHLDRDSAVSTHRRCDNTLLKKLGYRLKYRNYKEGFPDIIKEFKRTQ